mmetsp:Transcript_29797/g.67508  ORF Transcript_29797/g.67508 Transcript_29797/m.67508 type:complete len:266 (-) Transcript_29797:169-966(-)
MSALVRITTGIMPQHSRVGMTRAMTQFGEVIHCHKPPYSGIPGEDFVNVRFASQDAADRAYAALKSGQVFVDGFQVGVGPTPTAKGMDALALGNGPMRRRSPSPPRRYGRNRQRSPPRRMSPPQRRRSPSPPARSMPARGNFPSRNDPKSPSPRRLAREMNMNVHSRSRSRMRERRHRDEGRSEFSGGGGGNALRASAHIRVKEKERRTPSPDPPGPAKNMTLVKNPFFRPERERSPSPELNSLDRTSTVPKNQFYQATPAFDAL